MKKFIFLVAIMMATSISCDGRDNPTGDDNFNPENCLGCEEDAFGGEENTSMDTAPDAEQIINPDVLDPCTKLYVIEKKWCETEYGGNEIISLNIDWPNDMCIVSLSGNNVAIKQGKFYGKELPLIKEGGGWYYELRVEGNYLIIEIVGPNFYSKEYFLPC